MSIKKAREFYKKRDIAKIPGYHLFGYVATIIAMRNLGCKHRIIADYLNEVAKDVLPGKITNTYLANLLSKWKLGGFITESIQEEAKKIAIQLQLDDEDDETQAYKTPVGAFSGAGEGVGRARQFNDALAPPRDPVQSMIAKIEASIVRKLEKDEIDLVKENINDLDEETFLKMFSK